MRCKYYRCEYNVDGFCESAPECITIGEDGTCDQMWVKKKTITEKYTELKNYADEVYKTFDANPTQANSDNYGMALNNLRDFCIEVIEAMIKDHPEITNKIFWEED